MTHILQFVVTGLKGMWTPLWSWHWQDPTEPSLSLLKDTPAPLTWNTWWISTQCLEWVEELEGLSWVLTNYVRAPGRYQPPTTHAHLKSFYLLFTLFVTITNILQGITQGNESRQSFAGSFCELASWMWAHFITYVGYMAFERHEDGLLISFERKSADL